MPSSVELCAGLDRDLAAAAGGAPSLVFIHVDRKGDDSFEVMVGVSVATTGKNTRQAGTWIKPELDIASMRAIVAWAAAKHGVARATFSHWSGWTGSHEQNARELARVFEASPTSVVVSRGTPMTERGEPPMGQPSFKIALDAHGIAIEVPLFWVLTNEDEHDRVLADAQKEAEALAKALGVPCDVV